MGRAQRQRWRWTTRAAGALALVAAGRAAGQTAAGTPLVNVAALRADGLAAPAASNAATLVVAERLDCTLARTDAATAVPAATLTNTGNGHEAFALAAVDAAGAPLRLAVDDDGDGRFDPAHDHLVDGASVPLAPGTSLRLLVPDTGGSATVTLTARALTASGTAGTLAAGAGDGGGDAVVGATGAAARLVLAAAEPPAPTLVKSQSVAAADGGTAARHGATVTYTLVARFAAAAADATILDPLPAGTDYLAASLSLDGVAVTDAGRVADGRVTMPLGAVAAGAVHTLRFQVVIR